MTGKEKGAPKALLRFYNHYGNNTTDTAGNRIGTLYVFDTKRERDEWNDDEDYRDGNLHREAISAKEARRMLVDYIYGEAPFRVSSKFFCKADVECLSTEELVKLYRENPPYDI